MGDLHGRVVRGRRRQVQAGTDHVHRRPAVVAEIDDLGRLVESDVGVVVVAPVVHVGGHVGLVDLLEVLGLACPELVARADGVGDGVGGVLGRGPLVGGEGGAGAEPGDLGPGRGGQLDDHLRRDVGPKSLTEPLCGEIIKHIYLRGICGYTNSC